MSRKKLRLQKLWRILALIAWVPLYLIWLIASIWEGMRTEWKRVGTVVYFGRMHTALFKFALSPIEETTEDNGSSQPP